MLFRLRRLHAGGEELDEFGAVVTEGAESLVGFDELGVAQKLKPVLRLGGFLESDLKECCAWHHRADGTHPDGAHWLGYRIRFWWCGVRAMDHGAGVNDGFLCTLFPEHFGNGIMQTNSF